MALSEKNSPCECGVCECCLGIEMEDEQQKAFDEGRAHGLEEAARYVEMLAKIEPPPEYIARAIRAMAKTARGE